MGTVPVYFINKHGEKIEVGTARRDPLESDVLHVQVYPDAYLFQSIKNITIEENK